MSVGQQKSFKDIPFLEEEKQSEWVSIINELITQHNFLSKNLSLQSNFDGQIIENIAFTAGETKQIPHSLGIIPPYRIILRQVGNGVISDIPSDWTDKSIKLINNGAVSVTVTIMIVRE